MKRGHRRGVPHNLQAVAASCANLTDRAQMASFGYLTRSDSSSALLAASALNSIHCANETPGTFHGCRTSRGTRDSSRGIHPTPMTSRRRRFCARIKVGTHFARERIVAGGSSRSAETRSCAFGIASDACSPWTIPKPRCARPRNCIGMRWAAGSMMCSIGSTFAQHSSDACARCCRSMPKPYSW